MNILPYGALVPLHLSSDRFHLTAVSSSEAHGSTPNSSDKPLTGSDFTLNFAASVRGCAPDTLHATRRAI